MTTTLAIDSTTGPCSVAIWKDGRIAAYLENLKPSAQSATLMPMVEQALSQSTTTYRDLSAIAATIGPGSFTGIRIGLAAARGIAFSSKIKTLGFSALEVMAFSARTHAGDIIAVINAGKGEVYHQRFTSTPQWQTLNEPQLSAPEAIPAEANTLIISNLNSTNPCFPRADTLAELAALRAAQAHPLTPFYIRPPDAKLPAKKL